MRSARRRDDQHIFLMNENDQSFLNALDKQLWGAADKLRSNVNPGDYMHVVLGLIFLKYISDAFKERRTELDTAFRDPAGKNLAGLGYAV